MLVFNRMTLHGHPFIVNHMLFRLLGNFTEAAKDLSTACKIDFDEKADEWLKEVLYFEMI